MLWCSTQILLQDGGTPSLSFSSGDAPCWAPCWELPLAADTCLTQGDTSFPGEPTSNDQLASVKGLSSSLLCSPTQALGLPSGWVEAFAEAASPFKCFCSVLRPSLPGRCWTPTHSLCTNPHLRVCFLGNPTYVNHLDLFFSFCCSEYFGEHLRLWRLYRWSLPWLWLGLGSWDSGVKCGQISGALCLDIAGFKIQPTTSMELRALDGRRGTVSLGKWLDDSHAGLSLGSLPVLRGGICHTHGRQVEAGGASILSLFSSLWSPWERGVRLRSSGEILTLGVTPVLSLFALTSLLESQLCVCWELTPPQAACASSSGLGQ